MKKIAGVPKRQYTRKKITKKAVKAAPRKTVGRKRARKSADFLKALQLAATLAAISVFVSLVVIFIHSNFQKRADDISKNIEPVYDTQVLAPVLSGQDDDAQAQTLPQASNDSNTTPAVSEKNTVQPIAPNVQKTTEPVVVTSRPATTPATSPAVSEKKIVQPAAANTQKTTEPAAVTVRPSTNTVPAAGTTTTNNTRPAANVATNTVTNTAASAQKPVENKGTLVFVIDDAGNNLRELEPFLRIQAPLTIAVLPGLPYSAEAARRIRAAGKEVFLHQPMEALGGQNPGPGAIYSGMSAAEIRSILKRNIDEVGPVAGMNNHQGSKITEDREMMQVVLSFCRENGLYFLDSRTTANTVVPDTAKGMGMKIGQRDTFIDNEQDRDSMNNYIKTGLERAKRNGSSVMIGHTWSPQLAPLLAEQFAVFSREGYSIKTASDIIK